MSPTERRRFMDSMEGLAVEVAKLKTTRGLAAAKSVEHLQDARKSLEDAARALGYSNRQLRSIFELLGRVIG